MGHSDLRELLLFLHPRAGQLEVFARRSKVESIDQWCCPDGTWMVHRCCADGADVARMLRALQVDATIGIQLVHELKIRCSQHVACIDICLVAAVGPTKGHRGPGRRVPHVIHSYLVDYCFAAKPLTCFFTPARWDVHDFIALQAQEVQPWRFPLPIWGSQELNNYFKSNYFKGNLNYLF